MLNVFAVSCTRNNESAGTVTERWETLDERCQLALARSALDRAICIVAGRAETLAGKMENGDLADQGGVEALRLFATLTRCASLASGGIHDRIAHGQSGTC